MSTHTGGLIYCHKCGVAYAGDTRHDCSFSNGTFTYNPGLSPIIIFDEETKALLRRIADALEKMAEE